MRAWGFCQFVALLMLLPGTGLFAAGNDNFAGVTWVLYQNRHDFVSAHQKVRNQFAQIDGSRQINRQSFFSIPPEQYFPVSIQAAVLKSENTREDSFELKLEEAAATLDQASYPNLIINIVSHGTQAGVGREFGETIPLNKIVRLVVGLQDTFRKRTTKPLTVWFMYSACDSGYVIDMFESELRHRIKGTYHNGDGRAYTAPLHVFTSADEDDYGYGSEFVDSRLTFQTPHPTPEEIASHAVMPNWVEFGARNTQGRFNHWSSFNPRLTSEALHHAIEGTNELEQRTALRALKYLDVPDPALGSAFEALLSSSRNPIVQIEAMKVFRARSVAGDGQEKVDAAVLKLFEFSRDMNVRAEAAFTLNFRRRYPMEKVVTRFVANHYSSMTLPAKVAALKAVHLSRECPKKLFSQIALDYIAYSQANSRATAATAGNGVAADKRQLDAFLTAARANAPADYSELLPYLKATYFNEGPEVKADLVKLVRNANPNPEWLDLLITEYITHQADSRPHLEGLRTEIQYSLQSSMGTASELFPLILMDSTLTEARLRKFLTGSSAVRNDIIVDILAGVKDPKSPNFQKAIRAITWARREHSREVLLRLLESGWTRDHQGVYSLLAKLYDSEPEELRRIGPGILETLNTRFEDSVFPLGGFVSFRASELMKADIKGADPRRAGAALHFVGAYGGPKDFPLLIEGTRSATPLVKRSAIVAMAHVKAAAEEISKRLDEIVEDATESPELRVEALRTIQQRDPVHESYLVGKLFTLKADGKNQCLVDYVQGRILSTNSTEIQWFFLTNP